MVNVSVPDELSKEQRSRIISEIEAVKYNKMRVEGEHYIYRKDEFIDDLRSLNHKELADYWSEYVGEWLQERRDLEFENSFEVWIKNQWKKLLDGDERDYTINSRIEQSNM